jgi:trigger factor
MEQQRMMEDVQVSLESAEGLQRRLKVNVPSGRIEAEVTARLRHVGRTAAIRGYRPGKAPEKVIRQRFGDQVFQEVIQDILQASYSEAVSREKLRPAASPRIQAEQAGPGQDLVYTADLEVFPEFELKGLDALAVERPEPATDPAEEAADIAFVVENLRKQRAHWHKVDRPARKGDRVVVDFEGFRDGKPMEGGKGEGVEIVVGAGRMIADFEKALEGVVAGGEKDFTVTFPADYQAPELAGQKADFKLRVHEVGEEHLPEPDAEFIRSFGIESGETEAFHADIRRNIASEFTARARAEVKRQLLEQLLQANPIAIPETLVQQEASVLQSDAMRNLGIQDPAEAPAVEAFRETAERRVRLGLLVGAVIRENGIQVDQDRLMERINQLAAGYPQPEEVRKIYLQNRQLLEQVEQAVLEEQVIDWLAERARVTAKPTSFRSLVNAQ